MSWESEYLIHWVGSRHGLDFGCSLVTGLRSPRGITQLQSLLTSEAISALVQVDSISHRGSCCRNLQATTREWTRSYAKLSLKHIRYAEKTLKAQTHTQSLKSLIDNILKSRKTYLKILHPNRFKGFIHKI